jgi:hypothetical protein
MVILGAFNGLACAYWLCFAAGMALDVSAGPAPPAPPGGEAVQRVLARQGYPWYDAGADRFKPILPSPDFNGGTWKKVGDLLSKVLQPVLRWFRSLNGWRLPFIGGLGDLVAVGLALLLLTLVLVGLLELLRRYRPPAVESEAVGGSLAGRPQRIEGLPGGVRLDAGDPWAEAQRLRARGDYAGAVVYLFAHQLLSLQRLRQIRLIPGRTGRQLVRSVADRGLRAGVDPTLRLFEAVYYGHKVPSREAFEDVWSRAESFERKVTAASGAAGVAS